MTVLEGNVGMVSDLPEDFYQRIKDQLRERIARELRFATRVLDVGCGSCELARFLAGRNRQRVIGVDISEESFPDDHLRDEKVECHKGDAGKLDFLEAGSVEAVVTVHALHEMQNPLLVLKEAKRILGDGGEILVVDFPKGSLAEHLWKERYYATGEITRMLQRAGFGRVESTRIARGQLTWARAFKRWKGTHPS